jgi:predicted ATPase with chaperone activity
MDIGQPLSVTRSLLTLSEMVTLPGEGEQPAVVIPPVPETLEQTGLNVSVIEQLILKLLYFRGDVLGRDLASAIGLRFSVIDTLLDGFKRQQQVEVKRSLGMGSVSAQFSLTESGRKHAQNYLDSNQYVGRAPVPIEQYSTVVRKQRAKEGWLTRERLAYAYRKMIVTERVLSQIGPAVSSGNSFLIYGQPGNGKTFLAEALANIDDSCIYMPYAIECQGMIVQLYDPIYHEVVPEEDSGSVFAFELPYDGRWFKCKRPFIVSGGELTLEMLDLNYNASTKVYEAPFQLKATNGIYLIDDFGRQRVTPAEVLNRWIVPLERRIDYLTFRSGGKMTVPFEAFLIFSTNLRPEQLGDEAFLRRIQYKMRLQNPSSQEYTNIFKAFSTAKGLVVSDALIERFILKYYGEGRKQFRRCHPRDILSHALDLIHFEKLPFDLTDELLDRAFESCFVEDDIE